jgi:TPR repeat protein
MRNIGPVVFLIAAFMLLGASGCTKTVDDARSAYDKREYKTAYGIFKSLAKRGDAGAQFRLGEMYKNGQGVPRNDAEALKWFRRAADQGHAGAQNSLGIVYTLGQGVPVDYVLAYMWYSIAASNYTEATERGGAARNMDAIIHMMTPGQVQQAQKKALEWKPKKETVREILERYIFGLKDGIGHRKAV